MPASTMQDMYDYALTFFDLPYIWGGDGLCPDKRQKGYDCSGLVQVLLAYGNQDPKGDQNADSLYRHFLREGLLNTYGLGALAFFGSHEHVTHIGWCLDKRVMINASGGGSQVKTTAAAKRFNASVKIEPIHWRKNFVAVIMPQYWLAGIV